MIRYPRRSVIFGLYSGFARLDSATRSGRQRRVRQTNYIISRAGAGPGAFAGLHTAHGAVLSRVHLPVARMRTTPGVGYPGPFGRSSTTRDLLSSVRRGHAFGAEQVGDAGAKRGRG